MSTVGGEHDEVTSWLYGPAAANATHRPATRVFAPMFLSHLELSIRRTRAAPGASEGYDTVPFAIGFVDLSGFTEHSSGLSPAALRDMIVDFEGRANAIVGDHEGRIVKLTGPSSTSRRVSPTSPCRARCWSTWRCSRACRRARASPQAVVS